MVGLGGGQFYRLTVDPTPHPLDDSDMVALATIGHIVNQWIRAEVLPPELVDDLKECPSRYKVVKRGDSDAAVVAAIFDVTRRLHRAFARDDGIF